MTTLAPERDVPEIPPHAYAIAAAYRDADKEQRDVAALTRLFSALPDMKRDILAAWDRLDALDRLTRLETAGA